MNRRCSKRIEEAQGGRERMGMNEGGEKEASKDAGQE